LRAAFAREASVHGKRVLELCRQVCERINTDFNVDDPPTPPWASQKLIVVVTLLRAIPEPSTPDARNLHHEVHALIEQAAVLQAECSASRIRNQSSARGDGDAQDHEASAPRGRCSGTASEPGHDTDREWILDTRSQAYDGDARNVLNAKRRGDAEARATKGSHP
jgi:hypothetical protein